MIYQTGGTGWPRLTYFDFHTGLPDLGFESRFVYIYRRYLINACVENYAQSDTVNSVL